MTGSLAGISVVIVEDDAAVGIAMTHLLTRWGCRCRVVEAADEAIATIPAGNLPDVLICDYRLRDHRTGADAIAALRAHWGRPIPALLVTGDTAPERMREAVASGLPLIHKPVQPDILHRRLLAMTVASVAAAVTAPPG